EGRALPNRRLDGACGVVYPLDEMPAEREPVVEPLAQHFSRHPEHPPVGRSPPGGEIDAVLVEGAEPPGPAARHVHSSDPGVLAADVAHQVDGPVEESPPVIRVLALAEQLDAGLDANLGAALGQLRQLVAGQAVKDAERAKLVGVHQIMVAARYVRAREHSGWLRGQRTLEGRLPAPLARRSRAPGRALEALQQRPELLLLGGR